MSGEPGSRPRGAHRSTRRLLALLWSLAAACFQGGASAPAQSEAWSADLADSIAVARDRMRQRDLPRAEALLHRLLPRAEQAHGDSSAQVAEVLDLLAEALWQVRGPSGAQEALPLAKRAVALKERLYGPGDVEVASSLFNLGVIHAMSGRYDEAERVFETIYAIRAARLPQGDPETLTALNALGNVMKGTGDLPGAVEAYERGLEAARAGGTQQSEAATVLRGNLGGTLSDLGRFDEARPLLQTRVAHYDSSGHPSLSGSLNDLANVEVRTGNYPRAAQLYQRALALEEGRAGPLTRWAIRIRGNTAANLVRLGEYTQAWTLLERQAALLDSTGTAGLDLGQTYERLAHIAAELGDGERELELRRRAVAILEDTLPADHPRLADALYNLGTAHGRLGDLDRQEEVLERAQAIWTSRLGARHESLADYHLALGEIARRRGHPDAARRHTEEALRVARDLFGDDSPRTAAILSTLGALAFDEGRLDDARRHLNAAFETLSGTVGADHPLAAEQQVALARVEQAAGDPARAAQRAFAAEAILTPHLRLTLRNLPERQALLYVSERSGTIDVIISLLDSFREPDRGVAARASQRPAHATVTETAQDPALVSRVWDAVIRTRALVFDELASRVRQRDAGANDPGAAVAPAREAYQRAATRLANLIVNGPPENGPAVYRALLAGAREDLEAAERDLAGRRWPGARGAAAGFEEVCAALPPGTALVAYVRYDRPGASGPGSAEGRYRAFVLASGQGAPRAIDIGATAGIDALIADWRRAVASPTQRGEAAHAEVGRLLRRVVWDPVARHVARADRILIVPADHLHLVNLAALPDEGGAYLIEAPQVMYQLTAEREVVRLARPGRLAAEALVVGDPDFDWRPSASRTGPTPRAPVAPTAAAAGLFRGKRADCDELTALRFGALASSRHEAEEVAAVWRRWRMTQGEGAPEVRLLAGADATEAAFKRWAPGCRLLHVATHGVLLDPSCSGGRSAEATGSAPATNPLLYSGLALAGANHRAEAAPGEEDGLLTAQEIASLDLSGLQWAVLSACDSRGRAIVADEGVFGLQRAFRIAGARTVLATLWPVEDASARAWMDAFYEAGLERELGTAAAVRAASLSILRQRRAGGADDHPFYWGAYVGSGDWR